MENEDNKIMPFLVSDLEYNNGLETEEVAIEQAKKYFLRGGRYGVYKLIAHTEPTTAHVIVTRH